MILTGCEPRCPGCAHRELSAGESESEKARWLRRALSPWDDAIESVRGAEEWRRWNYRDKTLLHAIYGQQGWEFGMLRPGRRREEKDEIIPIPGCPVHTERVRGSLAVLSRELPSPEGFSSDLRFVAVSGALMTWVLKTRSTRDSKVEDAGTKLLPSLQATGISGLFINFNPSAGRRVFSSGGWRKLWGDSTALGSDGHLHGPQSFQQPLTELFEDALGEAASWLGPESGDFVLDLYSGRGTSIRKWRSMGAESFGVELLGEAVDFFPEAIFRGRVSERIPQLETKVEEWKEKKDGGSLTVFANPPRTGLEPAVIEWIGRAVPSRISYLSCSPGTLGRDLSKLEDCAYRVKRIIPYDFFPQTAHVEALALLELDSAQRISDSHSGERVRRPQ